MTYLRLKIQTLAMILSGQSQRVDQGMTETSSSKRSYGALNLIQVSFRSRYAAIPIATTET